MKHFFKLYKLMDEFSEFNSDPFKCYDLSRKADLESEIKEEFRALALVRIIDFFRKLKKSVSKKRGVSNTKKTA